MENRGNREMTQHCRTCRAVAASSAVAAAAKGDAAKADLLVDRAGGGWQTKCCHVRN